MSKFRFTITVSLDGFVAGPEQSLDEPLGVGGEDLHEWVIKTRVWRETAGMEGGETGVSDDVVREWHTNIGATIMGRNMFGGGRGDWGNGEWTGWWGNNPPYHTPVYVLTHHAREPLVMDGGTTFFFVTDGIESALRQAREAAGEQDVALAGGASVAQQYLAAGLLDEVELHIVPLFLKDGARLFDNLEGVEIKLDPIRAVEDDGVTHIKYRVLR